MSKWTSNSTLEASMKTCNIFFYVSKMHIKNSSIYKHSYHQFTFTVAACCGIVEIPCKGVECSTILNCVEIRGLKNNIPCYGVMNLIIVRMDKEIQWSQQVTAITIKQLNLHIHIFRFYIAMVMHKIKDSINSKLTLCAYWWPSSVSCWVIFRHDNEEVWVLYIYNLSLFYKNKYIATTAFCWLSTLT